MNDVAPVRALSGLEVHPDSLCFELLLSFDVGDLQKTSEQCFRFVKGKTSEPAFSVKIRMLLPGDDREAHVECCQRRSNSAPRLDCRWMTAAGVRLMRPYHVSPRLLGPMQKLGDIETRR